MPEQATAEDLAPPESASLRSTAMPDGAIVEENIPRPPTGVMLGPVAVDPHSPDKSDAPAVMPDQATTVYLAPSGSDGATVEEKMLRPPWVILGAVTVDRPSPGNSDFVLSLCEPPRVSALTPSRRISPDSESPGSFGYVVAVDPGGCFLLYATQGRGAPAFFFCDPQTGAASRLPDPAVDRPLRSFESVGFISCHGASGCGSRYMVADLQPAGGTGGATLLRHWTHKEGWTVELVKYSSESAPRHPLDWKCSTVISNDGMLYWVDMSLGVLICDAFLDSPVLRYLPLPEGCNLQARMADLDKRHCWVGISAGNLSYLKIDGIPDQPTFCLWKLTQELSWSLEYQVRFEDIWHSKPLRRIKNKIQELTIALVDPRISNVIYFKLGNKMHIADLGGKKTRSTNMERDMMGRRFSVFHAWELPGCLLIGVDSVSDETSSTTVLPSEYGDNDGELVSHLSTSTLSTDIGHRRSLTRLCYQGAKVGQILLSQLGVSASSMGSNLFYLNEEVSEAKSFFKHMGEFQSTGQGYVARTAGKSAKISKSMSKILGGGAGSALSYGGTALSSIGFSLQRLHPQAQTGGSGKNAVTEIRTVESIEEARNLLDEWQDTKEHLIVDVPSHMEIDMADKIMRLYRTSGAIELVEKSPILLEKSAKVLYETSDWDMV